MSNQQSGAGVSLKDIYKVKVGTAEYVVHTGDTNETVLKSHTISGGSLGINGSVRIKVVGTSGGNNGNKTVRLKFGGQIIAQLVAPASVGTPGWTLFSAFYNRGVDNSQYWSYLWTNELVIALDLTAAGSLKDTSLDQVLEITGQLGNAADVIGATEFIIEVKQI